MNGTTMKQNKKQSKRGTKEFEGGEVGMSNWYGNNEKDYLLDEMKEFLNNHSVGELLDIVTTAVEQKEDGC